MTGYRVCFYKELLSSDGHPFKCLQGSIDVGDADTASQAAEAACRRFEALHGSRTWAFNADSLEVITLEGAACVRSGAGRAGADAAIVV